MREKINVGKGEESEMWERERKNSRGVNVRPNPRTRHEPDTGFSGLVLGLNGFGS